MLGARDRQSVAGMSVRVRARAQIFIGLLVSVGSLTRAYEIAVREVVAGGQIPDRNRLGLGGIAGRPMANGDLLLEQEGPGPGYAARAGRHERAEERPRAPVVTQHAAVPVVLGAGDVQVPVGPEGEAHGDRQAAATRRHEYVDERAAGAVEAKDR